VRFHSSARHFQLSSNFGIVTTLQKQLYNLLLARTQPNGLFVHHFSPFPSGIPGSPWRSNMAQPESFQNP
jgi:hypothetical protein